MKNVFKSLAKRVLIPLGLPTAVSAADAGIHKNILGSGTTTLKYQMMKWKILSKYLSLLNILVFH